MATRSLKVVVTRKLPDPIETRLRELFDAELNDEDRPFTQEALVDLLQRGLVDEPPATLEHGDAVRPGYSAELDELILRHLRESVRLTSCDVIERWVGGFLDCWLGEPKGVAVPRPAIRVAAR